MDYPARGRPFEKSADRSRKPQRSPWIRTIAPMVDLGGPGPSGPRVLILSADIGEGHDLPASAVADELARESPSVRVRLLNGLPDMGRLLSAVLRDGSWFFLRRMT